MKINRLFILLFFLHLFIVANAAAKSMISDSVLKITYIRISNNPPSPKFESLEYLVVEGNKSYYFNYMASKDKNGKIPIPFFTVKDRNSSQLFFSDVMYPKYPVGSFWSDSLPAMKWQIYKEYKTFKNVVCQKASTYFRGRYFTAYFATSIPIPDGPWKLCGLPGLIMNIKDSKGIFEFEVEKIEKIVNIYVFKMGTVYGDYEHYKQLYKAYFIKQEEKRKARKAADPNCLDCGDGVEVRTTFLEEIFD